MILRRKFALTLLAGLLIGASLGVLILFGLGVGERLWGQKELSNFGAAVESPVVDSPAPDFELESLSGEQIRLSELRGKPVLINFWATWCGPCVLEMPNIQEYYEKFPGEFAVLAVNADEPRRAVETFSTDLGLTFDILLDPGGKIQRLYQMRGYPTSFLVDQEGIIQVQHIGILSEKNLEEYLNQVGVGK